MTADKPQRSTYWGAAAGALVGVGVSCLAYGSLIERNHFTLREEALSVLPHGSAPLRVLHLSDIHMDRHQAKKTAWLRSLAELKPDLVINTGDNLTHPEAIDPLLDALAPLLKIPGLYVPGSNDYYAPRLKSPFVYFYEPSKHPHKHKHPSELLDTERLHAGFDAGNWINMTNRHQSLVVNGVQIAATGVDDPHLKRERYAGWPVDSPPDSLKLALCHAPYQRVLNHFTEEGAQLIVAGHTHGGQVCIPGYGALVSNCDLSPRKARGVSRWEYSGHHSWLEVSGGIGTSRFAPVRFACPPEAVLLTLTD